MRAAPGSQIPLEAWATGGAYKPGPEPFSSRQLDDVPVEVGHLLGDEEVVTSRHREAGV
jgi:hypothetical protein